MYVFFGSKHCKQKVVPFNVLHPHKQTQTSATTVGPGPFPISFDKLSPGLRGRLRVEYLHWSHRPALRKGVATSLGHARKTGKPVLGFFYETREEMA